MSSKTTELYPLGKSLSDYADAIKAGLLDAAHGIMKAAMAYKEACSRFSNADKFFASDPRTRCLSKYTRDMLMKIADRCADPRLLLVTEPRLAGFISKMPCENQTRLFDTNPTIRVVDRRTQRIRDVAYIDVTAKDVELAYDSEKNCFRSPSEQRKIIDTIKEDKIEKRKKNEKLTFWGVDGLVFFVQCKCGHKVEMPITSLVGILKDEGYTVSKTTKEF